MAPETELLYLVLLSVFTAIVYPLLSLKRPAGKTVHRRAR
jgi:hypothetical protein